MIGIFLINLQGSKLYSFRRVKNVAICQFHFTQLKSKPVLRVPENWIMLEAVHMKIVFPLFSRFTGKKILFPRFHIYKYFPAWARFILADCLVGKFWEKPIFKVGDTNLKKNGSVLFYLNISGLDSHFMFDGSSTTIRYSKTT